MMFDFVWSIALYIPRVLEVTFACHFQQFLHCVLHCGMPGFIFAPQIVAM